MASHQYSNEIPVIDTHYPWYLRMFAIGAGLCISLVIAACGSAGGGTARYNVETRTGETHFADSLERNDTARLLYLIDHDAVSDEWSVQRILPYDGIRRVGDSAMITSISTPNEPPQLFALDAVTTRDDPLPADCPEQTSQFDFSGDVTVNNVAKDRFKVYVNNDVSECPVKVSLMSDFRTREFQLERRSRFPMEIDYNEGLSLDVRYTPTYPGNHRDELILKIEIDDKICLHTVKFTGVAVTTPGAPPDTSGGGMYVISRKGRFSFDFNFCFFTDRKYCFPLFCKYDGAIVAIRIDSDSGSYHMTYPAQDTTYIDQDDYFDIKFEPTTDIAELTLTEQNAYERLFESRIVTVNFLNAYGEVICYYRFWLGWCFATILVH